MLWWVNRILHTFGLVIAFEYNDSGEIIDVYPVRTKFRGFDEKTEENGYKNVSKYIVENAEDIYKEASEG